MPEYDAIVIGTGQAGPSLARRLADAGMSVAVVERGLIGGTCVNTGCTPTKTLVASAEAAHIARRAAEFGVSIAGPVGVDMKRVKARKDAVVDATRKSVLAGAADAGKLHALPRPGALHRAARDPRRRHRAEVGADLYQCRRPRFRAARCPGSIRSSISPTAR